MPSAGAVTARRAISTQGIVAALPRRAGEIGDGDRVAVLGPGGRPVGLEQVALDALERRRELGPGGRGELAGEQAGAAQPFVERDEAMVSVDLVGVGLAVFASVPQPVGECLGEVGPPHGAGLTDEERFGVGER